MVAYISMYLMFKTNTFPWTPARYIQTERDLNGKKDITNRRTR